MTQPSPKTSQRNTSTTTHHSPTTHPTHPLPSAAGILTALLIPAILFSVHLPSVNLTAPKQLIAYLIFAPLTALFLADLIRRRRMLPEPSAILFSWRRRAIGSLMALIIMMLLWRMVPGGIMIRREVSRILPGLIIALFWWFSGVSRQLQSMVHRVFAVSAAILALGGVAQILGLDPVDWEYSFREGVFSFMGHPNMLAPCLVMGLACQWGLARAEDHRHHRRLWGCLVPLTAGCLVLTFSKGAWFGVMLALCIAAILLGTHRLRLVIVSLCVAAVLIGIIAVAAGWVMPERLVADNSLRPAIWSASLTIPDTPIQWLIGRGPGTWFIHFPSHRSPIFLHTFRRTENIRHAHSEPVEFLVETGLTGVLLVILLITFYVRSLIRARKDRSLYPGETAAFWGVLAVLIHSTVSVNFRTFSVWTVFWIFWAFSRITHRSPEPAVSQPAAVSPWDRWVHAVVIVLVGISLFLSVGGIRQGFRAMQSATALYQGQTLRGSGDLHGAVTQLERAAALDPGNLDARYDLAVTLYEAGQYERSEKVFDTIAVIAPDFQRIHMNRAILYLQWGRRTGRRDLLEHARKAIERELALNDKDANHYILGSVEMALGNIDAGKEAFRVFLDRMAATRAEMERLRQFRRGETLEMVVPKNWELLLQMEAAAQSVLEKNEAAP